MQQLFESWSLSRPQIPQRTPVYAQKPMAVGTAMTESLSSYIIRLAEAHSVTLGDFIGRMLAKIPNPKGTLMTRMPYITDRMYLAKSDSSNQEKLLREDY